MSCLSSKLTQSYSFVKTENCKKKALVLIFCFLIALVSFSALLPYRSLSGPLYSREGQESHEIFVDIRPSLISYKIGFQELESEWLISFLVKSFEDKERQDLQKALRQEWFPTVVLIMPYASFGLYLVMCSISLFFLRRKKASKIYFWGSIGLIILDVLVLLLFASSITLQYSRHEWIPNENSKFILFTTSGFIFGLIRILIWVVAMYLFHKYFCKVSDSEYGSTDAITVNGENGSIPAVNGAIQSIDPIEKVTEILIG